MGLEWTKPVKIKNDRFILTVSEFPDKSKFDHDLIWYIWKRCKKNIKNDDIEMQKDNEKWYIAYTHKITSDSNKKSPASGKRLWLEERETAVKKWTAVYMAMAETLMPLVDPKPKPKSEKTEKSNIQKALETDEDGQSSSPLKKTPAKKAPAPKSRRPIEVTHDDFDDVDQGEEIYD